jgi:uncharacterized protein
LKGAFVLAEKPLIAFVEKKPVDISGYTLIEGFPGMGLVGTIAAKYLSEKLDCVETGYVVSETFLPIIRIHNGLPVHPSRIYVSNRHKVVLLVSEQVVPQAFTDRLSRAIADWIQKKKIKRVVSLGGIRALPQTEGKQTVYGIASDEASKKMLVRHNVDIIKDGITSGITALMMLEFKDRALEAFSLLGNVQIAADYQASAALVEKLNEMFSFNIDTAPLKKEAKETEKALVEHLKQLREVSGETKKLEPDMGTPMYT